MSKFKVGDRIVSYGFHGRFVGTVTMMNSEANGRLEFVSDAGRYYDCFPQQCRKLVKKPRKRIWVPKRWLFEEPNDNMKNLFTEYVEVKKK